MARPDVIEWFIEGNPAIRWQVTRPEFTRVSFPLRWYYEVLRASRAAVVGARRARRCDR